MPPAPSRRITASGTTLPVVWNSHSPVPARTQLCPACEKCCHDHDINATTLHSAARWNIPDISCWQPIADSVRGSTVVPDSWTDYNRHLTTCIACGQGDNSSQHWTRFCIIPVLVANALSSSDHTIRSLDQLARTNTAGCVVASHILHQFRRLLLEHGGMQHSKSSVTLSVPEWLTRLHDNCIQAIPTRYLPETSSPIRLKTWTMTTKTTHVTCRLPLTKQ